VVLHVSAFLIITYASNVRRSHQSVTSNGDEGTNVTGLVRYDYALLQVIGHHASENVVRQYGHALLHFTDATDFVLCCQLLAYGGA